MFLISWNVAGLSTTFKRIQADYSQQNVDANPTNKKLPCNHSLSYYFERHGSPDIICLQEHKIPLTQLRSRSEPISASSIEGYESFWSCCVDPKRKGLNGTVTYAKTGTVASANGKPFDNSELDNQGRCVMTDHGRFVVFNVYVPANGGMSLQYKIRFLQALRKAMKEQREMGKKVVLVGDLNISHKGEDVHWSRRMIHVPSIIQELKSLKMDQAKEQSSIQKWKTDLYGCWDKIKGALSTIEAVPVTTKNITTGTTFEKFRSKVTIIEGNKSIFIGNSESTKEDALACFFFPRQTFLDETLQKEVVCQEENSIPLGTLIELMSKIGKVDWNESTVQVIAQSPEALSKSSPTIDWFNTILESDKMIDTFRFLYPDVRGRFTCWNQQFNRRFENIGSRIDYAIIDSSIREYLDNGLDQNLRCCNLDNTQSYGTDEAALHAATASGQFQGAGFGGGGISSVSQKVLDTQFGARHTGIIYTPPSYSDHVAISLLLKEEWGKDHLRRDLTLTSDSATKRSQPHKGQQKISSFFGTEVPNNLGTSVKRKLSSTDKQNKKSASLNKKKGILRHFGSSVK